MRGDGVSLGRVSMYASVGIVFVLAFAVGQPTAAGGVSPAQLEKAGWGCLEVFGAIHCAPPGMLERIGTATSIPFLVFSTEGEFLGTEIILHDDVFAGQPCPSDPPGEWTHLPDVGLDIPYWACHHYDSSF